MTNSKELAKLVGPTAMVLIASETMNFHIWATNIPAVTYLNGIILFVVGISILRNHNLWMLGWPVLLTLVGWFCILLGLFRVFLPEAQQASPNTATNIGLFCLFLVGTFLTYKAYSREAKKMDT